MNDYQKIKLMVKGNQTTDGEGVKLQRVIANQNIYDFDPFLMLVALIQGIQMIILKAFHGILIGG